MTAAGNPCSRLLLLALCCAHCSGDPPQPDLPVPDAGATPDVDAAAPRSPTLSAVLVTENPGNALSAYVYWTSNEPGTSGVHVECGSDYAADFENSTLTTDHELFVMGLVTGSTCTVTVRSTSVAGGVGQASTGFSVPALPAFLPEPTLDVHEVGRTQSGWTLVNLTNQIDNEPLIVAFLDEQGRYRWYFRQPGSATGSATQLQVVPEGVAIGGPDEATFTIANWQSEIVYQESISNHHDFVFDAAGRLVYLSYGTDCPGFFTSSLAIWNFDTESIEWTWNHCEHYQPLTVAPEDDWSHLNSVTPFPGEPAVMISSRNQSALYKVSLETGDIEWMLGFPPGPYAPTDIPVMELVGGERFYERHAPEIQPDGESFWLFDNGSVEERPVSRAIEIGFDETGLEARVLRDFRPDPPLFSDMWGDADQLDNGNVLATFGSRSLIPSHLVEFGPDGKTLWKLHFELRWGVYRADRISDIPLVRTVTP